jgi:hypothetical protein
MATKKRDVTPLDRLRGEIWVKGCLRRAGVNTLMDLWRKTESVVPDRSSWSQYKAGKSKPTSTSVTMIDRLLPGTAFLWNVGPFNDPYWDVLSANQRTCDSYLRGFLSQLAVTDVSILYDRNVQSLSLPDCLLGLLQWVLPEDLWRRYKDPDITQAIDELYALRKRLMRAKEEENSSPANRKSLRYENPILEELAASYYEQGLLPPWEEDLGTVEGVAIPDPVPEALSLPFTGISDDDFLSAFFPDPDFDDELEIGYETAPVKSLKYVPKNVRAMAHQLTWTRLPPSKKYIRFSLSDLLVIKPNPLRALYGNYLIDLDLPASHENLKKFDGTKPSTPFLFKYDLLLAFIAAIMLCRKSREPLERSAAVFLWDGVHLAIRSQFNQDIYDIVKP